MERKRGSSPASLPSHFRSRANSVSYHHETRPLVVLSSSTMHLVGVPLIILSSLATGFILVWLKEILIPFVVAMFFVYLLRPLVNLLTQPCARCCHRSFLDTRYALVDDGDAIQLIRRKTASSKMSDDGLFVAESGPAVSTLPDAMVTVKKRRSTSEPYTNGKTPRNYPSSAVLWAPSNSRVPGLSCCRLCTITRCPRWLAVLVSLMAAFGVLSLLVLLVADAVNSFESNDLKMYQHSAIHVTNMTLTWVNIMFHVDGSSLLKSIKTQVPVADLVQKVLVTLIDAVGNTFLIMLVVLYLLFEQTSHPAGSLRRKIDEQIQRYIGIKTLISAFVGFMVYLVLGPLLSVKLAHLFGVLTFFLNYIPNVGPVIATAMPLPIIVLDPNMSTTPKLLAMALPTLIHIVVGNVLEPKVFGRQLELHPVVVLMALAFWFAIWGVVGAILSIPVTAVVRIVLSHIDHPYAHVLIRLLEGHIGLGSVELVERIGVADIEVETGSDGGEGTSMGGGDAVLGGEDLEAGPREGASAAGSEGGGGGRGSPPSLLSP